MGGEAWLNPPQPGIPKDGECPDGESGPPQHREHQLAVCCFHFVLQFKASLVKEVPPAESWLERTGGGKQKKLLT